MNAPLPSLLTLPPAKRSATGDLPLLGFVVWWSLQGVQVTHTQLEATMREAGFAPYLPAPPSYPRALRRALAAWVRQHLDPAAPWLAEEDEAAMPTSTLIRSVRQRGARHALFALVAESQQVAALDLSYATALRILLDRQSGGMVITTAPGDTFGVAEDEAITTVVATEAEAQQVAADLLPLWDFYRDLHLGSDLTGIVRRILCGETVHRHRRQGQANGTHQTGLDGVPVRRGGGLYFVPAAQQAALERAYRDALRVVNKSDRGTMATDVGAIRTVATTGEGMVELRAAIRAAFLGPPPFDPRRPRCWTERQRKELARIAAGG